MNRLLYEEGLAWFLSEFRGTFVALLALAAATQELFDMDYTARWKHG